jgi:hypothetical protein
LPRLQNNFARSAHMINEKKEPRFGNKARFFFSAVDRSYKYGC